MDVRTILGIVLYGIAAVLLIYILKNILKSKLGTGDAIALLGIIISAIGATNLLPPNPSNPSNSSNSSSSSEPTVVKSPIVGNWQFVRYDGTAPSFGTLDIHVKTISFYEDGKYNVTASVTMPNGSTVDGAGGSGTYKIINDNTIEMENKDGAQQAQFFISGNELKLVSPGLGPMILQRI